MSRLLVSDVVRRHRLNPSSGAIVFSWDDGFASQWDLLRPLINERGQKHSFFPHTNSIDGSGRLTAAQIANLHAEGHEIGSHSHHHNSTGAIQGLDPEDRAFEYDHPKEVLEGIIGAPVTSWVYPTGSSSRSDLTDQELYGRYQRIMSSVSGRFQQFPGQTGFYVRRRLWNDSTHAHAMLAVRAAAEQGVVVHLAGHNPGGDPSLANLIELLDLVRDLGLRTLTPAEAYPAPALVNPIFDSDLDGWGTWTSDDAVTVEAAERDKDEALPGNNVLRIDAPSGESGYAFQNWPVTPGRKYVLSCRYRVDKQAGGDPALRVEFREARVGESVVGSETGDALTSSQWDRATLEFTAPEDAAFVRVDLRSAGMEGEVLYDHVHLGEARNGDFG